MRIKLAVDDCVGKALKELAHCSDKSFNQVVNETLERRYKHLKYHNPVLAL